MSIFGIGPRMALAGLGALVVVLLLSAGGVVVTLPESWSRARLFAAVLLALPGVAFWLGAVVGVVRARRTGRLVTDGVYRFSRNPMYAAFILFLVPAIALIANNLLLLAVSLAMYAVFTCLIGQEEAWLRKEFGEEYESYCRKVGRLLSL